MKNQKYIDKVNAILDNFAAEQYKTHDVIAMLSLALQLALTQTVPLRPETYEEDTKQFVLEIAKQAISLRKLIYEGDNGEF